MRRRITVSLLSVAAIVASLIVVTAPAQAHGWVTNPPSRQDMCAEGRVSNCGDIVWEPQSVEAPKGSLQCNGGGSRFAVLNDESRNWPATQVGNNVTFTWQFTARHRTLNWEYFVGGTRIAVFSGNASQPPSTLSHNVNLGGRTGRIKVLARWNIYDTINAFYSCIDLQVGDGPPPTDPPPTDPPPSDPPPSDPPPSDPPPGGTWEPNTAYTVGDVVTYGGVSYQCRQSHTSLPGWEPPNVLALWLPL